MKKLLSLMFLLVNTFAFADELTVCEGKFALCAASTCTKTGRTITTNNGGTYPEVVCKCPVLEGKSIADTSAGVMKGTCDVQNPDKEVWSLFAPKFHYPQEANNFVTSPISATRAKVQACPGDVAQESANCWGMMCIYDKNPTNGTVTAICSCPIGQIAQGIEFLTEAGQGNPIACDRHPVAAPDPVTADELFYKIER